jgi:hypothetical protein
LHQCQPYSSRAGCRRKRCGRRDAPFAAVVAGLVVDVFAMLGAHFLSAEGLNILLAHDSLLVTRYVAIG